MFVVNDNYYHQKNNTPSNPMPARPMPLCRVEIAAQSLVDEQLNVLLIRREEAPYKGF